MTGMERALKYAGDLGCETEFVVEPAEGEASPRKSLCRLRGHDH